MKSSYPNADLTTLTACGISSVQNAWMRPGGGYRFSDLSTAPTLISTATAILIFQFLRGLKDIPPEHAAFCREWIRDAQRPDGTFADSVDDAEPTHPQPEWAFRLHRSRHNMWALEALGTRPRFPSSFVLEMTGPGHGPDFVRKLMSSRTEGGIWNVSNWVMDVLVQLDIADRHFEHAPARAAFHEILDFLEGCVDGPSGFWLMDGDDLRCGMAGTMHFYPAFWSVGRTIPGLAQAARSTLALQQPDSHFAYEPGQGGEQCLDLDAAYILRNAVATHPDLQGIVDASLRKLSLAQMVNWLPDGGWSDNRLPQVRHWASRALAYRSDGGSLWDTYARLLTAALCARPDERSPFSPEHHWFEIMDAGAGWSNGHPPRAASGAEESPLQSQLQTQ